MMTSLEYGGWCLIESLESVIDLAFCITVSISFSLQVLIWEEILGLLQSYHHRKQPQHGFEVENSSIVL